MEPLVCSASRAPSHPELDNAKTVQLALSQLVRALLNVFLADVAPSLLPTLRCVSNVVQANSQLVVPTANLVLLVRCPTAEVLVDAWSAGLEWKPILLAKYVYSAELENIPVETESVKCVPLVLFLPPRVLPNASSALAVLNQTLTGRNVSLVTLESSPWVESARIAPAMRFRVGARVRVLVAAPELRRTLRKTSAVTALRAPSLIVWAYVKLALQAPSLAAVVPQNVPPAQRDVNLTDPAVLRLARNVPRDPIPRMASHACPVRRVRLLLLLERLNVCHVGVVSNRLVVALALPVVQVLSPPLAANVRNVPIIVSVVTERASASPVLRVVRLTAIIRNASCAPLEHSLRARRHVNHANQVPSALALVRSAVNSVQLA